MVGMSEIRPPEFKSGLCQFLLLVSDKVLNYLSSLASKMKMIMLLWVANEITQVNFLVRCPALGTIIKKLKHSY